MSEGMRPDGPDDHPLMAVLYDLENPWCAADDAFLAIADRAPGSRLLDVGCGTGTLTHGLARAGHRVTAVEPNRSFLDAARAKPGADDVTWIQGRADAVADLDQRFDTVLMTGHVAQAFVDDDEWQRTLTDLHAVLVPGGRLAFDSRDPEPRGWEKWAGGWSGTFPDGGAFTTAARILRVDGEVVTFEVDTTLPDGERRQGVSDYRFRSAARLRTSVERAGFVVDSLEQDGEGEIVVVATKP